MKITDWMIVAEDQGGRAVAWWDGSAWARHPELGKDYSHKGEAERTAARLVLPEGAVKAAIHDYESNAAE